MAKDLAVKDTNTAVGQVLNFEQDAGAGLEGADKNSFAIPFLTILQGLSPQCEPVKDGGIEGAKAGLFINSITNELYEDVNVIPCAFQRQFLRWAPNRGGFKGQYPAVDVDLGKLAGMSHQGSYIMMDVVEGQPAFDDKGQPNYDFLSDTRNHFVLMQTKTGSWTPALLSLGSTQIKKSKRWLSLIQGVEMKRADGSTFNPPSFSHVYKLTTVKEENAKGKWQGLAIEGVGPVTEAEVYAKAKKFNADVVAGAVEVSPPPAETTQADDKF